jgi:hypothetical protein
LILIGVVLAVAVALLRGGRLDRLAELGLRAFPLVWLAIGLRVAAAALTERGFFWAPWLQVLAYVLFMYVMLANHRLAGLKTFGLGSFFNFLVIAANGGRMPVSATAIMRANLTRTEPSGIHSLLTEHTRLWFLADIIPVPGYLLRSVVSIGDILIVLGMFFFIQHLMLRPDAKTA